MAKTSDKVTVGFPARESQETASSSITIPEHNKKKLRMVLVGKTPLIVHAWSEKAKLQMRTKQQKGAKMAKEAKDPKADFQGAKYLDSKGRDSVRAAFFKNAIVSACRFADDLKMTVIRGALFVEGDLLPLKFKECNMREDTVRVGMGTADLRYRPEYTDWSVEIVVEYLANVLTPAQIVNLIRLAGFSVGICEWRPEKNGDFGRFDVDIESVKQLSEDGRKAA